MSPADLAASGSAATAALAGAANATLIPRALAIPNTMFLCATAFGTAANWAAVACMALLPPSCPTSTSSSVIDSFTAASTFGAVCEGAVHRQVLSRRLLFLVGTAALCWYCTWLIKFTRRLQGTADLPKAC